MSEEPQKSLEQLRRKAARFPTDLKASLELGAALHARGHYFTAIKKLNPAMCDPHCACRAMRLLIEAYQATGRPDRPALIRERFLRQCGRALTKPRPTVLRVFFGGTLIYQKKQAD